MVSLNLLDLQGEFKASLRGLEILFIGGTFACVTLDSSPSTAIIIILLACLLPWVKLH